MTLIKQRQHFEFVKSKAIVVGGEAAEATVELEQRKLWMVECAVDELESDYDTPPYIKKA